MADLLKVNGVAVKCPSKMDWGLSDVSDSSSGRTQDINATMYKNRIAQKRKLELSWNAPTPEEASKILQAFNDEYFDVYYFDPLEGKYITKTFYCGDRSAPMKIWTINNKRYSQISFNIVER